MSCTMQSYSDSYEIPDTPSTSLATAGLSRCGVTDDGDPPPLSNYGELFLPPLSDKFPPQIEPRFVPVQSALLTPDMPSPSDVTNSSPADYFVPSFDFDFDAYIQRAGEAVISIEVPADLWLSTSSDSTVSSMGMVSQIGPATPPVAINTEEYPNIIEIQEDMSVSPDIEPNRGIITNIEAADVRVGQDLNRHTGVFASSFYFGEGVQLEEMDLQFMPEFFTAPSPRSTNDSPLPEDPQSPMLSGPDL